MEGSVGFPVVGEGVGGSHILHGAMKPHSEYTECLFGSGGVARGCPAPLSGSCLQLALLQNGDHQLLIREQIHSRAAEELTD